MRPLRESALLGRMKLTSLQEAWLEHLEYEGVPAAQRREVASTLAAVCARVAHNKGKPLPDIHVGTVNRHDVMWAVLHVALHSPGRQTPNQRAAFAHRAVLSPFFTWCVSSGRIKANPLERST